MLSKKKNGFGGGRSGDVNESSRSNNLFGAKLIMLAIGIVFCACIYFWLPKMPARSGGVYQTCSCFGISNKVTSKNDFWKQNSPSICFGISYNCR